jgi:hypothetical protein
MDAHPKIRLRYGSREGDYVVEADGALTIHRADGRPLLTMSRVAYEELSEPTQETTAEWEPPEDLDAECKALCIALNRLPGLVTESSCCGHGKAPFRIWFRVTDFEARGLVTLARCTCPRYYPFPFTVMIEHGDVHQVGFLLEGPADAFKEADALAAVLMDHVLGRTPGYNILQDDAPFNPRPLLWPTSVRRVERLIEHPSDGVMELRSPEMRRLAQEASEANDRREAELAAMSPEDRERAIEQWARKLAEESASVND